MFMCNARQCSVAVAGLSTTCATPLSRLNPRAVLLHSTNDAVAIAIMVGFGISVGDFIAGIKLIGTIVDALKQSGKSTTSFQHLIEELNALDTALQNVLGLQLSDELRLKRDALGEAVKKCLAAIEAFDVKLQPYRRHLHAQNTTWRLKESWSKIRWAVSEKEDVALFRAEIRGHTSSLTILLLTVQLEAFRLETRSGERERERLLQTLQKLSDQAHVNSDKATTRHVERELENAQLRELLQRMSSEVQCLKEDVRSYARVQGTMNARFSAVCGHVMGTMATLSKAAATSVEQGKRLLEASITVVEMNFKIFAKIHDLQLLILRIPGQPLRQQPVYFTDPFNRITPFYLEFIRSPAAFLAVMEQNFEQAGCGIEMLKRREFVIEDAGTRNAIDIYQSWDNCFFPGQRATMNMIFKADQSGSSCPSCSWNNIGEPDCEVNW